MEEVKLFHACNEGSVHTTQRLDESSFQFGFSDFPADWTLVILSVVVKEVVSRRACPYKSRTDHDIRRPGSCFTSELQDGEYVSAVDVVVSVI